MVPSDGDSQREALEPDTSLDELFGLMAAGARWVVWAVVFPFLGWFVATGVFVPPDVFPLVRLAGFAVCGIVVTWADMKARAAGKMGWPQRLYVVCTHVIFALFLLLVAGIWWELEVKGSGRPNPTVPLVICASALAVGLIGIWRAVKLGEPTRPATTRLSFGEGEDVP